MNAANDRRVVLKFVIVSEVGCMAELGAAAIEGSEDQKGESGRIRLGQVRRPEVLKASLIDDAGVEDGSFRDLDGLAAGIIVITARDQIETANPGILPSIAFEGVAYR